MLGSLPIDKGDATASPFHMRVEAPIGRGIKALNPGGAGANPLRHSRLPLRKSRRPLIMRASANLHRLRRLGRWMKWAGRLPVPYLRTGHRILGQEFSTREELLDLWKIRGEN